MDWIERFFHFSPDAGSGSFEFGIMIGALVGVVMILFGVLKAMPAVRFWFDRAFRRRSDEPMIKHVR